MLPDTKINSSFLDYLLANNRDELGLFKKWLFYPGMLFNSMEQWWGGNKPRPAPHEGLDLCFFEEVTGRIRQLDKNIDIPATFAGEIIKIAPDFLGASIYLRHQIFSADGRQLYTAYGHTQPGVAAIVGKSVAAGEVIATIADFSGRKTDVLPHLHLTCAWVPTDIQPDRLTWPNLGPDPDITLLDPLEILSLPA